jgi:UDP-glucose 4-epimerase
MILIVGGAGYVGSHINKLLFENNYETLIFDNLIYGHKSFVKWGKFIHGDLNNKDQLRKIFLECNIELVIHCAAFAYVNESVNFPGKYYQNNVSNTINLLEVMVENDCNKLIFSSSCAVYGIPIKIPIDELHPTNPINPYGRSKLMVEQILDDFSRAYNFKYVSLRYFNAAGADFDCEIGEYHNPETHLIPLALDAALGKSKSIKIFGNDYETKDGSAIRDYIHVNDLALAHMLAAKYLTRDGKSDIFNLGNGVGYSVFEILNEIKKITNVNLNNEIGLRREGDPSILISNANKAKKILGWEAIYGDINMIINSAWKWHKKIYSM